MVDKPGDLADVLQEIQNDPNMRGSVKQLVHSASLTVGDSEPTAAKLVAALARESRDREKNAAKWKKYAIAGVFAGIFACALAIAVQFAIVYVANDASKETVVDHGRLVDNSGSVVKTKSADMEVDSNGLLVANSKKPVTTQQAHFPLDLSDHNMVRLLTSKDLAKLEKVTLPDPAHDRLRHFKICGWEVYHVTDTTHRTVAFLTCTGRTIVFSPGGIAFSEVKSDEFLKAFIEDKSRRLSTRQLSTTGRRLEGEYWCSGVTLEPFIDAGTPLGKGLAVLEVLRSVLTNAREGSLETLTTALLQTPTDILALQAALGRAFWIPPSNELHNVAQIINNPTPLTTLRSSLERVTGLTRVRQDALYVAVAIAHLPGDQEEAFKAGLYSALFQSFPRNVDQLQASLQQAADTQSNAELASALAALPLTWDVTVEVLRSAIPDAPAGILETLAAQLLPFGPQDSDSDPVQKLAAALAAAFGNVIANWDGVAKQIKQSDLSNLPSNLPPALYMAVIIARKQPSDNKNLFRALFASFPRNEGNLENELQPAFAKLPQLASLPQPAKALASALAALSLNRGAIVEVLRSVKPPPPPGTSEKLTAALTATLHKKTTETKMTEVLKAFLFKVGLAEEVINAAAKAIWNFVVDDTSVLKKDLGDLVPPLIGDALYAAATLAREPPTQPHQHAMYQAMFGSFLRDEQKLQVALLDLNVALDNHRLAKAMAQMIYTTTL